MIWDLTKHRRCRYAVLELYSAGFCWVPPPSLHFISAAATVKVNGPTVESVLVLTSSPDNTFFSPLKYGVIHSPYVIFNASDKRFHHKGGLFTGSFEEAHPRVGKLNSVSVNYALRFSGPVTALTACRVRYGCRSQPHLPVRSFARYKDALVPRRFSNNSLPPFFPSLFTFLHRSPRLCLRPCRAPLTPCGAPLPTEPIRRGQWENAAARHAGSYSLDASAALSPRPSDLCVTPWTVALVKRPAFQQVAGDLVTRRP